MRPIEDIAVGDLVLAWNPESGETTPQRVTALIRPEPRLIWRLTTRDTGGQVETFEVTDDHPWYVEGVGWIETKGLGVGQRIETADDRGLVILDVAATDRFERTYNLEVDGLHTFVVGDGGAVVHNIGWCKGTFGSIEESIVYHFNKHGTRVGARSAGDYARMAIRRARSLGSMRAGPLRVDGTIRYVDRTHFLIMRGRNVVSFGLR